MVETNYRWKGITLPACKRKSIDRYVETGADPGHFLGNCLANDLQGAYAHADTWSLELIPVIVKYIYNRIPGACWGNHKTVENWRGMSVWNDKKERENKKLIEDWKPVETGDEEQTDG